jgi:hypothetical protein
MVTSTMQSPLYHEEDMEKERSRLIEEAWKSRDQLMHAIDHLEWWYALSII